MFTASILKQAEAEFYRLVDLIRSSSVVTEETHGADAA